MQTFNRLEHPVLDVFINGVGVEQPSSFSLITDSGFPSVVARLQFPKGSEIGDIEDSVVINLFFDDERHLLFTGEVYAVIMSGTHRELALTDGYKKLCDTGIIAAYRKETARVILQDTLETAGISETAITCPSVEVGRFSTKRIPADRLIQQFIKTLEEHGYNGFRFFFDEGNIFRFGTLEDTGKNEGAVFDFETGKNILKTGDHRIEVLPVPIRHSQELTVDGVRFISTRTELCLSGRRSLLVIWLRTALTSEGSL